MFDLLLCNSKAKSRSSQVASSKWQITEMAVLKIKSCVRRKKTGTRSKVNVLSQGTEENMALEMAESVQEGTQYIKQILLAKELAPYCLKMLDCFEVWCVYDLWELRKKVRNFWSGSPQAALKEHQLCPPLLSRSGEGQVKVEKRKKWYILRFL